MTTERRILVVCAAFACLWVSLGTPWPDNDPPPVVIADGETIRRIIETDKSTAAALSAFYADAAAILPDAVASNGQLRDVLAKSTSSYFPTVGAAGQLPGYSAAVSDFLIDRLGDDPEQYDPQQVRAALESLETIHR